MIKLLSTAIHSTRLPFRDPAAPGACPEADWGKRKLPPTGRSPWYRKRDATFLDPSIGEIISEDIQSSFHLLQ